MIIEYPHMTEKSMALVDGNNTLVFIVDSKSNKNAIKGEVEQRFKVKVEKVNVQRTQKGLKKAYVKLAKEHDALELATQLGML